jgi:hypothetical protein
MKVIILCLSLLLLSSCTSSGGSSDESSGDSSSSLELKVQDFTSSPASNGQASFSFDLPLGATSFQLSAGAGNLSSLSSAGINFFDRNDLLSSTQRGRTVNSPYYSNSANNFRSINAAYSTDSSGSVALKVHSKNDPSPDSGTLKINFILLGPAADSEDVGDALDAATSVLRETYSRAGISIDSRVTSFSGPGVAPLPGDPLYQSIVSSQRQQAINVVIAADRRGNSSNENRYGIAGSTPFPVQPDAQSVVIISLDDVTGDGVFDDSIHNDEERLLGEEIGRFVANAIGLPNAVVLRGNDVVASDDIPDSPSCISKDGCEDDSSSRTNLMFPEPLEKDTEDREIGEDRSFYPRDQLTSAQKAVLNNSVFVD